MPTTKKQHKDLLSAIAAVDKKRVKELLDSGTSANSTGWSVNFLRAAETNEDVREDIDAGESPADCGAEMTALIAAAQVGDVDICKMLVEAGADITIIHQGDVFRSMNPLMVAAQLGHLSAVQFFVERGGDVMLADADGRASLIHAVRMGHRPVVDFIRSHIEKSSIQLSLPEAAAMGMTKRVEELLKSGSDANEIDKFGLSSLHYACVYNYEKMVDALLKKGANPSFGSNFAKAKDDRVHNFVKRWAEYLVKPSSKNSVATMCDSGGMIGEAPILTACCNAYTNIVKKLLAAGCDINISAERGKATPLMMAVVGEDPELVQHLIDKGADLLLRDTAKATALDWAMHRKTMTHGSSESIAIIKILRDKLGVQPKEVDYKQVWKRFKDTEATKEFKDVIDHLSKVCETKPYPWKKKKGVQRFYVKNWDKLAVRFGKPADYVKGAPKQDRDDRKTEIASLLQNEVRDKGFLLVSHKDEEGSAMQLLFPTLEKFEVIAACGTDGYNYGYTNDDVIERLREVDAKFPFILTDCMHDAVGARLVAPIKNANELAKELYEFCTDLIDGDIVNSTEEVAKEIQKTQRFYLWWD